MLKTWQDLTAPSGRGSAKADAQKSPAPSRARSKRFIFDLSVDMLNASQIRTE